MLADADRAHSRSAPTVRDTERLVQIEVADVRAEISRAGEPHHGVHVGAVHVHLAAVLMHQVTDFANSLLEDSVSGGIGDHQRREPLRVSLGLLPEIGDVDVAVGVGFHHNHLEAGHDGARRVGAVRGLGNQADVPTFLPARLVIAANHQKTGELSLRARVRLQGHGVEARDLGELVLELLEKPPVALRLLAGREGMQTRELRPRDGQHLRRRVQLHGAGAERDHRGGEGQIARFQPLQIAQHLRLGPVALKDRVRQIGAAAGERLGVGRDDVLRQLGRGEIRLRFRGTEDREQLGDILLGRRLVEGDAEGVLVQLPEVDPVTPRRREHRLHPLRADLDPERVEEDVVHHGKAQSLQPLRERQRETMNPFGHPAQSVGAVIDGIHPRDDREKHLGGAYVAGRPLAANVLLAGLQGHPESRLATIIHRDADDPARNPSFELLARGEIRGVRPAVAQRNPETLRVADGNVGAPLAGRREEGQRQEVGGGGDNGVRGMRALAEVAVVVDRSIGPRILDQTPEDVLAELESPVVADHHTQVAGVRTRTHDIDGLRVALIGDEVEIAVLATLHCVAHRHRLGCGGGLVQQRRVGDLEPREIDDHGLEVQQRLQPALRYLRLVWSVGSVPAGILEHVAPDHRRCEAVGVPHADVGSEEGVLGCDLPQLLEHPLLGHGARQVQLAAEADRVRNGSVDQRFEGLVAEVLEHCADLVVIGTDVPVREVLYGCERLVRCVRTRRGEVFQRRHISLLEQSAFAAAGNRAPGRSVNDTRRKWMVPS